MRHPAAGHRRHPQHLLGRLRQPLDPGQQHIGQGGRQLDLGIAGAGGQQLLGVERVALRPGVECAPPGPPAAAPLIASRCSASSAAERAKLRRSTPVADQLGQQRPRGGGDAAHRSGSWPPASPDPTAACGPGRRLDRGWNGRPSADPPAPPRPGIAPTGAAEGAHRVEDLQLLQPVADERRADLLQSRQQPAKARRGGGDLSQQFCLGRIVAQATQGVHDGQVGKADVAQLHTAASEHPSLTGVVGELQSRRVLPTPASPASSTTCGRPCSALQCYLEPAQLISPADEPLRDEPVRHARQYGRGQRGNGSATRADPPPCWVPPTRSSAVQRAATSAASPAGVADAASERAPDAHGRRPADVRSCAARIARRSVRHVGCVLPSVHWLPSGWTLGLRCRPLTSGADLRSVGATTLSSPVAHPRHHETPAPRCRAAGPTRSYGTLRLGSALPRCVGWPGHGDELGAATRDLAGTAGSQAVIALS